MRQRQGAWTADEIILTIEAFARIEEGEEQVKIIAEYARDLSRDHSQVDAAIKAVPAANGGTGTGPAKLLRILAPPLLADRRLLKEAARKARDLWAELQP